MFHLLMTTLSYPADNAQNWIFSPNCAVSVLNVYIDT